MPPQPPPLLPPAAPYDVSSWLLPLSLTLLALLALAAVLVAVLRCRRLRQHARLLSRRALSRTRASQLLLDYGHVGSHSPNGNNHSVRSGQSMSAAAYFGAWPGYTHPPSAVPQQREMAIARSTPIAGVSPLPGTPLPGTPLPGASPANTIDAPEALAPFVTPATMDMLIPGHGMAGARRHGPLNPSGSVPRCTFGTDIELRDFEVLGFLGSGGTSQVFLARHVLTRPPSAAGGGGAMGGALFAIKRVPKKSGLDVHHTAEEVRRAAPPQSPRLSLLPHPPQPPSLPPCPSPPAGP